MKYFKVGNIADLINNTEFYTMCHTKEEAAELYMNKNLPGYNYTIVEQINYLTGQPIDNNKKFVIHVKEGNLAYIYLSEITKAEYVDYLL